MLAFLGTYPPRQCGIATFTAHLCDAISSCSEEQGKLFAVAMTDQREGYAYPARVKLEIRQPVQADYVLAADFLNHSPASLLCVQHEYGIYGGTAGSHLLSLLRQLRLPVVAALHTVLDEPDAACQEVFEELSERSERLVVMSQRAIDMLVEQGVPRRKLAYIPHGVPDLPFVDPNYYKDHFGVAGRKVILSFGLLGPDKGIEVMIRALPAVVARHPQVAYLVVGATHPALRRQRGEEYRLSLQRLVNRLGLDEHVVFYNRFLSDEELHEFLCASDLYVTPYLKRQQITSGTLSYAIGAGKAIVSTPYWYAEEALADGRGLIVPFRDADALAEAVLYLLDNEVEMHAMRKRAYQYGRQMVWPNVARSYLALFEQVRAAPRQRRVVPADRRVAIISPRSLPEPSLKHLQNLTDDFGLLQHARWSVPDYSHGYCLDDNARAVVVTAKYYRLTQDPAALPLLRRYLAFVAYCQRPDGAFRNLVSIDRRFMDEIGSDDCQGRALWGLGYAMSLGLSPFAAVAKDCFDRALGVMRRMSLRGSAYALLGLHYYLQTYPGALEIRSWMAKLAERIASQYRTCATPRWAWFEPVLTYDNGVIPQAMWLAARQLENESWHRMAQEAADFLFEVTTRDGRVSLVGNAGWFAMDSTEKAHFDQQPIDACGLVELAKVAYRITRRPEYLHRMQRAFDWFLGDNDVGVAVHDPQTDGCFDGLRPDGVNPNQGAESTLSYLLALLTLTEVSPQDEEHEIRRAKLAPTRTVQLRAADTGARA
ncbi:MAG: glycosyltransferase family 4 protein [Phycisphaerae bacterium]